MGLTLIEVIAGLALLGWLLSAVVLAKARHTRQLAESNRQLEAIEAADLLLARWWAVKDDIPLPRSGRGRVPGSDLWHWRVTPLARDEADALGIEIVRLQISDGRWDPQTPPAVEVDLVLPVEPIMGPDTVGLDQATDRDPAAPPTTNAGPVATDDRRRVRKRGSQ